LLTISHNPVFYVVTVMMTFITMGILEIELVEVYVMEAGLHKILQGNAWIIVL